MTRGETCVLCGPYRIIVSKIEKIILNVSDVRTARPTYMQRDSHTIDRNKKLDLWVSKEFEGVGNYRGQVVSHDVDMLGNTNYT